MSGCSRGLLERVDIDRATMMITMTGVDEHERPAGYEAEMGDIVAEDVVAPVL